MVKGWRQGNLPISNKSWMKIFWMWTLYLANALPDTEKWLNWLAYKGVYCANRLLA